MKLPRDIPKSVNILGRTVEVKLVADLVDGDTKCYGTYHNGVIQLCSTSHTDTTSLRRTYFHERVHAVLAISGLSEMLTGQLEEAICVAMESLV